MDIIEIINELRNRYLNNNNEVLVISVNSDGFTVTRKSRYQQCVEKALGDLEKTVMGKAAPTATTPQAAPVEPVKVLPIDRSRSRHRVPTGEEVLSGSHTSKWWSRYHFEKNLLTLAFHQLQDRFPEQQWFVSTQVARVMSDVMGLTVATAKKHITRALKLGIIVKAKDGANTILSLNEPSPVEGGDDEQISEDKELEDVDHEKAQTTQGQ